MQSRAKIGVVWFSCCRDFGTLLLSIRSVRHHYPEARCLVISDQRRGLEPDMIRKLHAIDVQTRTGTYHGGNLRGLPCVASIVDTLRSELVSHDLDTVLKIDSDTAWLHQRVLIPDGRFADFAQMGSFSGMFQGRWPWCSGGAYFVNRSALEILPKGQAETELALLAMDRARGGRYSGSWNEDQAVSALIDHRGGHLICWKKGAFSRWGFRAQAPELAYDFLEFGERHMVPSMAEVERDMEWHLDAAGIS